MLGDSLFGLGGKDRLDGRAGNDTLDGGEGNDLLIGGVGADSMFGGEGDDRFLLSNHDFAPGETIDGGAGRNRLILADATKVDFSKGTLAGLTDLGGSAGDDIVTLSASQWAGFDRIDLSGGTNTLKVLGSGDIAGLSQPAVRNVATGSLVGTSGADSLHLDGRQLNAILAGTGTVDFRGGGDVLALASTSLDFNTLGATDAAIAGLESVTAASAARGVLIDLSGQSEAFALTGGAFGDRLTGGGGADTLNGGEGKDRLDGGLGADVLKGGGGQDRIYGRDGSDTLDGGAGNDRLEGGTGSDIFLFDSEFITVMNVDTVADFQLGIDTIQLDHTHFSGLAPGQLSAAAFAIDNPTGTDPQVVYNHANGLLSFDSNGALPGGTSAFAKVTGAPALTADDFFVV